MGTYGEKLKELRAAKGITQTELSKASKVNLGSLRNHEQGIRSITSENLFAYCKALGVPATEFENCTMKKAAKKGR